jgi:hypothetical protein
MQIYTGAALTIHGVLDERIEVTFNNVDGGICLRFNDNAESHMITYGAAMQLRQAIDTALAMRGKVISKEAR